MRAKVTAWAAILIGSCLLASGQTPVSVPGYNCPSTCDTNPNCYCASYDVPGGLDPSEIPQFIVITNDDAVTVVTQPVILNITDKHQNQKNGCNIPATWFVSINYTDANLVQDLYMKNHEIATHTLHHPENPDLTEIVGAKLWLNQTAHVPLEKLRGFRSPFLYFDEQQRTILQQNGFLYDSTISEQWPTATSPGPGQRLWPYTMDYGLPQRCDLSTGTCAVNESHPGLWEFPLWDCQDDTGAVIASMDPPGNLYDVYKREFDRVYNGNRAPLGIYLHAARLLANPSTIDELNQFIDYATSQPNVWFATISQVIEWIKNPVPAANYTYNEGCKAPTDMWFPSGHFCKEVTCVHGNWSDVTCSCSCAGESLPNQPGFCQDDTGACTVAKVYDDSTRTFYCPGQPSNTPVASPSPAATLNPTVAAQTPSCGHPLLNFTGLGISGTEDNAQLYSNAVQAVDGLCTSCAVANSTTGNYFMVALAEPTPIQSVYVVTGSSLTGAYLFAGNSSTNSGLSNPACAEKFDVAAASPSLISCSATATYITLATSGALDLCDIYVVTPGSPAIDTSNLDLPVVASPSPAAALAPAPAGSRRLLL